MKSLLRSLIAQCELSIHKDGNGKWQISAKGPLTIIGLTLLAIIYHHTS